MEELQSDAKKKIQPIKKTCILCTKSEFKAVTRIAQEEIAAHRAGWKYPGPPSSHVPMADMSDAFYRLMLDAAD